MPPTPETTPDIVIYDGNCNLCTTLVQALERLDRGDRFRFVPMQDRAALAQWDLVPEDGEQGVILIDGATKSASPAQRWQGSAAMEEVARRLPLAQPAIALYQSLYGAVPGVKTAGDRIYAQVRNHRYDWFGRRNQTYYSELRPCTTGTCSQPTTTTPDPTPPLSTSHRSWE